MLSFLQSLVANGAVENNNVADMGSIIALGTMGFILMFVISIGVYIYTSFAFMNLAKKNRQNSPGLAWIPGVGPLIVSYKASKMHWWPWLLLIGLVIPFVNFVIMIVFMVFAFIWMWKLFEAVGKPGWWPLLSLIPFVGPILFMVFLGIAAWGK